MYNRTPIFFDNPYQYHTLRSGRLIGSLLPLDLMRMTSSQEIRESMLAEWHEQLSRNHVTSRVDSVSGSSPPSVFVGSYGYPKVAVGPLVPPVHGDTRIFDAPEHWKTTSLEQIIKYRMNLIRGVQNVPVRDTATRYIEDLQEVAMSSNPIDSDLTFQGPVTPNTMRLDDHSTPSGPIGRISSVKFSGSSPIRHVERTFYDTDQGARDAVVDLYHSGVEVSTIQKCLSIAMLGRRRVLVPTKWSITATDSMISEHLVTDTILGSSLIDSYRVFSYNHLGNVFAVVLFPHTWLYELTEAWHTNNVLGFGSDCEGIKGIDHSPVTAGAYFAAKLAVAEYLSRRHVQAGVLVLREIRPEYSIPVGVWQVRQGVREAMLQTPKLAHSFDEALDIATKNTNISKSQWLSHIKITDMLKQKTLSEYFGTTS